MPFIIRRKIEHYNELPLHVQNTLDSIGKYAEKCLDEASEYGEVIIITNSDDGWVKFSAERYVPYLLPVIERYRIVSARTRYERFYPNQPLCWKAAAFAHEVNEIFKDCVDVDTTSSVDSMVLTDDSSSDSSSSECMVKTRKEVISFGDSMEERTAVKIVANQLEAHPKSVMFLSAPNPAQIIGQLAMLTEHMQFVNDHELDLDIEISLEQADDRACSEGFRYDAMDKALAVWHRAKIDAVDA